MHEYPCDHISNGAAQSSSQVDREAFYVVYELALAAEVISTHSPDCSILSFLQARALKDTYQINTRARLYSGCMFPIWIPNHSFKIPTNFSFIMSELYYDSLPDTQRCIRLLRIAKGSERDIISCSLFQTMLVLDEHNVPDRTRIESYKALSYVWGSDEAAHRIYVDSQLFLIRPNLFSALRYIRRSDQDVILWVDAICINQKDKNERGHQVAQMRYVYEAAEEVLIWLGAGDTETSNLINAIGSIDEKVRNAARSESYDDWTTLCQVFMPEELGDPGSLLHSRRGSDLVRLLKNEWFKRVWVLQEISRAKTARIIYGYSSCPARTFSFIPRLMQVKIDKHVQPVLDIMPRKREKTWWSSTRYLHHLLQQFHGSQASEHRDKVYALLSMSEDANDSRRFFPCYEKNETQVWRDTVSFLIFREVLDQGHSFPEFLFSDLRCSMIELVDKTLTWAVTQAGPHEVSAQRTARMLVTRLNDGELKRHEIIESLARHPGQQVDMHALVSIDQYDVALEFSDAQSTLTVIPRDPGIDNIVMAFERRDLATIGSSFDVTGENYQEDMNLPIGLEVDRNRPNLGPISLAVFVVACVADVLLS